LFRLKLSQPRTMIPESSFVTKNEFPMLQNPKP
jgi:hypothetical protein